MTKALNKFHHSKIFRSIYPAIVLASISAPIGCGNTKTGQAISLQGSYQSKSNTEISVSTLFGCSTQTMEVSGTNMKLKKTIYTDTKCEGTEVGEILYDTSYSLGDNLPTGGMRAMDLTINSVTVTPMSDHWMGAVFSENCHLSDAVLAQPRNVSGMDCGAIGNFPAAGQIYFSSFAFDGDNVHFTLLPHEKREHIGSDQHPAERNVDLKVLYLKK